MSEQLASRSVLWHRLTAPVVAVFIGLILLFASVMKGLTLADTTVAVGRIPGNWWLSLAASAFELFLGIWLITAVFPATARRVALVCFLGLAGVALYKVSTSQESCGCLGDLHVDPKYVFLLDVLVVFLLCSVSPPQAIVQGWHSALVLLGGILVLTIGTGLTVYERATSLHRGLIAASNFHDFGVTEQHQVLTHVFTMENRCAFPVEVVQTTSSCNCTAVQIGAGHVIPPNGRLEVPVSLNTGEYEQETAGKITLYCRRAGSSSSPGFFQSFTVTATVEPDYWVRPLILNFGEVDHDRPVRGTFLLRPNRMADVRVTKVRSRSAEVTGRVLDERTSEGDIQVEMTFDGRTLIGTSMIEVPVTLFTSSRHRPHVEVMARAYYRAPVSVEPTAVVVASDIHGRVERDIIVTGNRPIRVEGLLSPSEIQVELISDSPNRWRVRAGFPAETARAGSNGEVLFEVRFLDDNGTAAAEARKVAVPLHRLRAPNQ